MNNRWIMVFDLETDAPNPQTCNAVELAAVPVNPRTLEIKAEQAFRATIKPDDIDKDRKSAVEKLKGYFHKLGIKDYRVVHTKQHENDKFGFTDLKPAPKLSVVES